MFRCQTSDMSYTQDQVNSVKHKRSRVYNGSGPYARRIDLFSNERKGTVLSPCWLTSKNDGKL